jgi:NDP-sugar pyrophosphorylase family protein
MSLYRVPDPSACGLVALDPTDRVVRFVEKPPPAEVFTDLASAGILVVEPRILRYIPAGVAFDFGHDLFPLLLRDGIPMYGLPIRDDELLVDIGTPDAYLRAQHLAGSR